jgi:hypothetical protein
MPNANNPRKVLTMEHTVENTGNKVKVEYVVYLHYDGTFRTIDINEVIFEGNNITNYVSATQGDLWDSWLQAGEEHWKEENEEPAPIEHD